MASKGVRRRLYRGSVEETITSLEATPGSREFLPGEHSHASFTSGSSREPLLYHEERCIEGTDTDSLQDECDERNHGTPWSCAISSLVVQCARWLANLVIRAGSIVGGFLPFNFFTLSKQEDKENFLPRYDLLQEEILGNLKERLEATYDGSRLDHQNALKQLWVLAFPGRGLPSLKSELWKEMGWQGTDPSTDLRGGGMMSLENLIFFAERYPDSFQKLLHKKSGRRSEWEYPFAAAGVNISFMLTQILELRSSKPTSRAGAAFIELLGENEMAFDILFCVAFLILDARWLAKNASYMEFNEVLKFTRTQLERELSLDGIAKIEDLPSFDLLGTR